jgi:hypothetical protein
MMGLHVSTGKTMNSQTISQNMNSKTIQIDTVMKLCFLILNETVLILNETGTIRGDQARSEEGRK